MATSGKWIAAIVLFTTACTADEQPAVDKQYDTPQHTSTHEFSGIASLRLLSDGRMVVSDWSDKEIVLLDSNGVLLQKIGRQGKGPGEYVDPRTLVPMSDDTTLVVDVPQHRFLVLAPDGEFVRAETFPAAISGAVNNRVDAAGSDALFVETVPDLMNGGHTAHVLKWTRSSNKVDTLTLIKSWEYGPAQMVTREGVQMAVGFRIIPHSHRDEWVALASGGIAVLRAADYSIEVFGGRDTTRLRRTIVTIPIPVSDAERAKVDDKLRDKVPANKQAFLTQSTIATTDDEVWSRRMPADSLARSDWDVTDVAKRTGYRVSLPHKTKVMAATRTKIYAVQYDEDDLPRIVIFKR